MILYKTVQSDMYEDLKDSIDIHIGRGWRHNEIIRVLEVRSSMGDDIIKQKMWYTADLTFNTSADKK